MTPALSTDDLDVARADVAALPEGSVPAAGGTLTVEDELSDLAAVVAEVAEQEEHGEGYLFANDFVIFDEAHTLEQAASRLIVTST